jgi:chitosanase
MKLSKAQRSLIERVINAFETSKADGDYGKIVTLPDGPHKMRQITYGRSQTTEYGNLRELVQRYVDAGGTFSKQLRPYVDRIKREPLVNDTTFKQLLRDAGSKDPVMKTVQDKFFEDRYFKPAMKWASERGFTLPLSALVIYDSFIHSGGILSFLRSRFPEKPPAFGGDEKAWTTAYVKARDNWLRKHSDALLRNTKYRTFCFDCEIQRNNWDLSQVPVDANGVKVSPI